jgi:hypothetical protein
MSDISKCEGTNCPLKETCFRFKAKSNEFRQAYLTEVPYDHDNNSCDVYWEVKKEDLRYLNQQWED